MIREEKIELCKVYNRSDIDCFQFLKPFCDEKQLEKLERLVSLNMETDIGLGNEASTSEEQNEYYETKWELLKKFGLDNRGGDAVFEGIAYGTEDEWV